MPVSEVHSQYHSGMSSCPPPGPPCRVAQIDWRVTATFNYLTRVFSYLRHKVQLRKGSRIGYVRIHNQKFADGYHARVLIEESYTQEDPEGDRNIWLVRESVNLIPLDTGDSADEDEVGPNEVRRAMGALLL
jgi:hypothetical protein